MTSDEVVQHFKSALRRRGYPCPAPRSAVIVVLARLGGHPTVEMIWEEARKLSPKISMPTVYRTMKLFEQLDLIVRREFGESKARYEIAALPHHHHIIVAETGVIENIEDERIEKAMRELMRQHGYELQSFKLDLHCRPILTKQTRATPTRRKSRTP